MDGTAIAFTGDLFDRLDAKTTHGLIRGSRRYRLQAVLDRGRAGQDAGTALDGRARDIPIYADLSAFLADHPAGVDYLVLGVANAGGLINPDWMPMIEQALGAGISVVNGLHSFLSDQPQLCRLAEAHGAQLIDVRKPKPKKEQHFWSGRIYEVSCPIVPVLGTDCAVGKRTTALMLLEQARARGLKAEMIYTGQTGWMQDGRYGFIFDSTLNDFVCGELEHAIVSCYENEQPDFILVEGQAALRNPSGPCGSEFLVSGHATATVLVHPPGRQFYKGWERLDRRMPDLASEVALAEAYGAPVLGLALNTEGLDLEQAQAYQQQYAQQLARPVALPVEEGVAPLLEAILKLL